MCCTGMVPVQVLNTCNVTGICTCNVTVLTLHELQYMLFVHDNCYTVHEQLLVPGTEYCTCTCNIIRTT